MTVPTELRAAFDELLEARRYARRRYDLIFGIQKITTGLSLAAVGWFLLGLFQLRAADSANPLLIPGFYFSLVPMGFFLAFYAYSRRWFVGARALFPEAQQLVRPLYRARTRAWTALVVAEAVMLVGGLELFDATRDPFGEPNPGLAVAALALMVLGPALVFRGIQLKSRTEVAVGLVSPVIGITLILNQVAESFAILIGFGFVGGVLLVAGAVQMIVPVGGRLS